MNKPKIHADLVVKGLNKRLKSTFTPQKFKNASVFAVGTILFVGVIVGTAVLTSKGMDAAQIAEMWMAVVFLFPATLIFFAGFTTIGLVMLHTLLKDANINMTERTVKTLIGTTLVFFLAGHTLGGFHSDVPTFMLHNLVVIVAPCLTLILSGMAIVFWKKGKSLWTKLQERHNNGSLLMSWLDSLQSEALKDMSAHERMQLHKTTNRPKTHTVPENSAKTP